MKLKVFLERLKEIDPDMKDILEYELIISNTSHGGSYRNVYEISVSEWASFSSNNIFFYPE